LKNKIKVILKPDKNRNYIVTTAMGEPYLSNFTSYSMPSWIEYCNRFGLGLAIVDKELINSDDKYYKKPIWQQLLIGKEMQVIDNLVNNICYLDTDIIISPIAPNIFDFHDDTKISITSLRNNLPFSYDIAIRKMAFFRNKYYDQKYPLDSALFISNDNLFKANNLELPKIVDEVCAGMYVFNVKKYSDFFEHIFYLYTKDIKTLSNGGIQTHFNYHVLNNKVNFLSYKFQAMWVFEQAMKYPFLYDSPSVDMINKCVDSVLLDNYFLHFAGSWHESEMWKSDEILKLKSISMMNDFAMYLKQKVSGEPVGMVTP
jgi:hypothetical protein